MPCQEHLLGVDSSPRCRPLENEEALLRMKGGRGIWFPHPSQSEDFLLPHEMCPVHFAQISQHSWKECSKGLAPVPGRLHTLSFFILGVPQGWHRIQSRIGIKCLGEGGGRDDGKRGEGGKEGGKKRGSRRGRWARSHQTGSLRAGTTPAPRSKIQAQELAWRTHVD